MKKIVFVGAMLLLAGCGTTDEDTTAIKEQNEALQQQIEATQQQVEDLQQQLEQVTNTPAAEVTAPAEEPQSTELQTFATDGNTYTKTTVSVQPQGDENIYEAMLRTIFPIYTFNDVQDDGDTIIIDVHENSTGSPNMTATGQVSTFLDTLNYTLATNFPELKGYYLTSNGEETYLGDFGPFDKLQYLADFSLENMYLPIEE